MGFECWRTNGPAQIQLAAWQFKLPVGGCSTSHTGYHESLDVTTISTTTDHNRASRPVETAGCSVLSLSGVAGPRPLSCRGIQDHQGLFKCRTYTRVIPSSRRDTLVYARSLPEWLIDQKAWESTLHSHPVFRCIAYRDRNPALVLLVHFKLHTCTRTSDFTSEE